MFFIAISSGLLHLVGYSLYAKGIFSGNIKPNAASWSIWAFSAVLEGLSYIYVTNDVYKNILPIICTISSIALVVACFFRGSFKPLTSFEKKIVALDIIIMVIWYLTESSFIANLLLVITAVISFVPIIKDTRDDPYSEDATPWFVWSLAYTFQLIVVVGRWQKWEDLLYPLVFLVLHLLVAFYARNSRRKGGKDKTPLPEHL